MSTRNIVRTISPPLPDLELGFIRKKLEYRFCLPEAGLNAETGVILFAFGFGNCITESYIRDKLLPRLSDHYNCIVAAPCYFGANMKIHITRKLIPTNTFKEFITQTIGQDAISLPIKEQIARLKAIGLHNLPDGCDFIYSCLPEYQSFGLLPALDMVAVLTDLLQTFAVRRDRLHAFGTSYGGYIVTLLMKFLPHSFHAVVENSGFACASIGEMSPVECGFFHHTKIDDFPIRIMEVSPWLAHDRNSPRHISPSVLAIRDCTQPDHFETSKTILHSYHSTADELIAFSEKERLWNALDGKVAIRRNAVTSDMIDGRLYKTVKHGMKASLLGLFDHAMATMTFSAQDANSDFDRGTERVLKAGQSVYRLKLHTNLAIEMNIDKST